MAFPCVATGSVATTGKYFVVAYDVIRSRMYRKFRLRRNRDRWGQLDGIEQMELLARIDNAAKRVARRRYYRKYGDN